MRFLEAQAKQERLAKEDEERKAEKKRKADEEMKLSLQQQLAHQEALRRQAEEEKREIAKQYQRDAKQFADEKRQEKVRAAQQRKAAAAMLAQQIKVKEQLAKEVVMTQAEMVGRNAQNTNEPSPAVLKTPRTRHVVFRHFPPFFDLIFPMGTRCRCPPYLTAYGVDVIAQAINEILTKTLNPKPPTLRRLSTCARCKRCSQYSQIRCWPCTKPRQSHPRKSRHVVEAVLKKPRVCF